MNKQEYLDALRRALVQMPSEERERQLAYYDELISDMCEDGMSEAEAASRLGEPNAVAQELLAALPLWALVKTRVSPGGGFSPLVIALLILGFPLWFPLLTAVGAVLLSLIITLWTLFIAYAAVVFALLASAVALTIALPLGYVEGSPLMAAGLLLASAGAGILLALALPPLARLLGRATKAVGRGVKSIFIKKER